MRDQEREARRIPNGRAAAAFLGGGIGAFAVGLMTTLSEDSAEIAGKLSFYASVGPLSGKTTVAVFIWLIAWAALGILWKDKDVDFGKVSLAAFILLVAGILLTYPPFFEMLVAE